MQYFSLDLVKNTKRTILIKKKQLINVFLWKKKILNHLIIKYLILSFSYMKKHLGIKVYEY